MYGVKIGKRDENEAEVVSTLRAVGATVRRLHEIDLLVGFRGVNYLFEVKRDAKSKLTDSEQDFMRDWQGSAHVVTTPLEALRIIGAAE